MYLMSELGGKFSIAEVAAAVAEEDCRISLVLVASERERLESVSRALVPCGDCNEERKEGRKEGRGGGSEDV
jgi:hypothetical protein